MTTTTEKPKKIPAFFIFTQDEAGRTKRSGAAFPHSKGGGLNLLIDGRIYKAFPPRKNSTKGESA